MVKGYLTRLIVRRLKEMDNEKERGIWRGLSGCNTQ